MKIGLATENKFKVEAVKQVLKEEKNLFAGFELEIKEGVSSGVARQPKSIKEMIKGAKNRALAGIGGCDYGLGVEEGITKDKNFKSGYIDYVVCAVFDGQQYYLGYSSSFELPINFLNLIFKKKLSVGQVYRLAVESNKIKSKAGDYPTLLEYLSQGKLERKDLTAQALKSALVSLKIEKLNLDYAN